MLDGNGTERRTNLYDANGRLIRQMVRNNEGGLKYDLYYTKADNTANYDAAGNMLGYILNNDEAKTQYQYTNTYEKREGYVQTVIDGVHDKKPELSGKSTSTYDANGYLVGVTDSTLGANNRTFVNDANGRVLYAKQGSHIQRQLIVNGEVLGRYGEMVDDKAARNTDGSPVFKTSAEFNFGYQATAGNTPDLAQRVHVVGAGDTLEAIAKAMYGDSRLWYRIADANGMTSNADLKAGQLLKIPGTETSANNADTFRPYRPGEIIGDTNPNMPRPPPKKTDWLAQLLVVIVVVIVAAMTQQYQLVQQGVAAVTAVGEVSAAALSSTTLASVGAAVPGASMTAGAIAGAAGSVAGQIVGNALGTQQGFDFKQLALSALSGGVGGGLSGVDLTGSGYAGSIGNRVAQAALGNSITQGLGVATGMQEKFSWQGVLASAAGAGVGQATSASLSQAHAFSELGAYGGQIARGTVSGLAAGTTAALLRGGKISVQQVAVDAFGNVLGSSIADTLSTAPAIQGVGPNSSSAYVNGMDLHSDQAYEARRVHESIAQSSAIEDRRFAELGAAKYAAFASTVNGNDLPPDYVMRGGSSMQDAARGQQVLEGMRDAEIDAATATKSALVRKVAPQTAWGGGASGGRGFVNPADASTYGAVPFAGRSTITDPAAYGTRLSGLDAGKASVGIEKELQSLMRSQPDSPQGWAARGNALADLTTRYQNTMLSAGLQPDPVLLTTMRFQRSIARYQLDGDVSQLAGSAVASGVILGMETGSSGGGVRAGGARQVTDSAGTSGANIAGRLKYLGNETWESQSGLRYGPDAQYGNRVVHVLRHAEDQPLRAGEHGVFDAGRNGVVGVVDEAWSIAQKGGSNVSVNTVGNKAVYTVDMGRRIGWVGGQGGAALGNPAVNNVQLVIRNGNQVITGFPIR